MYSPVKRRVSEIKSMPAPVKGLNDTDSLATMGPEFALAMLNWFPDNTSLVIRQGYAVWQTGLSGSPKTLMPFLPYSGATKLLAATDVGIYDVTNQGTPGNILKTLHDGRLSYVQFGTVSQSYLVFANQSIQDPACLYDGTTFTDFTQTATPTNPGQISGVDPLQLCYVHSHKRRLWFIQKDTMTAWYLPIDQLGGTAKPFYLGGIFPRGGKLNAIYTWSLDAGDGLDDVLIFQTDRGEIAGYQGNDPDVTANWQLSSVHFISPSLTDRGFADFGQDLIALTTFGAIPLSQVVGGAMSVSPAEASLSKNISKTLNTIVNNRGAAINWEIINCPSIQSLVIIIPASGNDVAVQYVMNSVTHAWTQYDMPIYTATMYNMALFFTDGKSTVYRFGDTFLDNVPLDGSGGKPVIASFMQAYSYFEQRGVNKHYNLIRPTWVSNYIPSYVLDISVDFAPKNIWSLPEPPPDYRPASLWGEAIWGVDLWTPGANAHFKWDGIEGLGYCAALIIRARGNRPIEYVGADWAYEKGASL